MWGNLVTWRSKKQSVVVARCSAEAELRPLALELCEGLWIMMVMEELGQIISIKIFCYNILAINMEQNPSYDKSKHVEIDRHFIREKAEAKTITIEYVFSNDQVADFLIKPVCTQAFQTLVTKLECINISI